ncbi:MAG TPA: YdcF family protein [Terriglobales bacterium]|jgi:uncharacterized SAM-binding protein YcdF (DUF218 family)
MMRRHLRGYVYAAAAAAVLIFLTFAARILSVSNPAPADVILVLNGGTWARTTGGLALLRRGEAPRMVLDVDADVTDWGQPEPDLARQWIARLPAPEPQQVAVCASAALSTLAEAKLVQPCLDGARTVLIVTSQYHTRRAREIFRHVDPRRTYDVVGVNEPRYFGVDWWRHREWAKTTATEWCKLIWWEAVDRWRHP